MIEIVWIFFSSLCFPSLIRCQCTFNWFGRNCSEPNLCQLNQTNPCPEGFICQVTDENQECKCENVQQSIEFTLID